MRFGVSLPQQAVGADPAALRDFAQAAEALGYERLSVIDHVVGAATAGDDAPWAHMYTVDKVIHEPLTLLAYVAALTERIRLVTANLVLPQRQAVVVAKQAAELDVLSGGRLILGVGLGWNALEYRALGMGFADRGRRIEEQVAVMRRLWSEESVEFEGDWHVIEGAGLNPRPVQRPIPVWFGANAEAAIRRAARLADGWLVLPLLAPGDEARRKIDTFKAAAAAAGRDPDALPIDATVYAAGGGVDEWLERVEHWLSLGATSITFRTSDLGAAPLDAHLAALRQLAEQADA